MAFVDRTCRLAICVAGPGLLALVTPALATDLLFTSPTTWQGFYVGGALGGAWSNTDWRYDNHNWFNTIGPDLGRHQVQYRCDWDPRAAGRLGLITKRGRG